MRSFPILENQQVAVLCAELNTGHVMDVNFNLALDSEQEIYTIFQSFDNAVEFAKSITNGRKDIECVIYDKNNVVLKYVVPE